MHMYNRIFRRQPSFAIALLFAFTVLPAYSAIAQHDHDHGHDDIEFPEPTNFVDAATQVLEIVSHLRQDLKNTEFGHIHDDSIILARVARMLGRFALDSDSGVARRHVREVNVAGRELARIADALHDAADAGNESACREHLDRLAEHLAVIETNLKRITDRTYTAILTPAQSPVQAAHAASISIAINDDEGERVTSFDAAQGDRVQVIVVSDDLGWMAHEQPAVGRDGSIELATTFPHGGTYRLFLDFKPAGMPRAVATGELTVAGAPPAQRRLVPNLDQPQHAGAYEVQCHSSPDIHAGEGATLWFIVKRNGRPQENLQQHFGASGHLVAVSDDLKQFVRASAMSGSTTHHRHHHHDDGHDHADDKPEDHAGAIGFRAAFPEPGTYRLWIEFKHDDQVNHAAFTVRVRAADSHDEHDHDHHHGDAHGHD